jgi:outer membrane receptor for ferrienterochelin and colicins
MVGRFVSRLFAVLAFVGLAQTASAQAGAITGKVTDAATGSAVGGANVQALSGTTTAASVVSAENGTYRLGGLAAGSYTVVVTKLGRAMKRVEGVTVAAGGSATVNVSMTEVAAILNPIVTTDSRGATPSKVLDAPASISVVTSERIANTATPSIAGVLSTTPGLSISQGGLVQSNIVSRGFNNAFSGAMLNLQDYRFAGVPSLRVNVPFLFTGTNDDIDRIEVLNGPASALYGPNSANGVLHIITKSPFKSQGTTISVDGGGQALMRGALRHAGTLGSNWGYKFSGEYMQGTDWTYNDPNEPATFPSAAPTGRAGTPLKRDFNLKRYSGEFRLDYKPSDDLENIFTTGYTKVGSAIEITTAFGAAQVKNWTYSNFQDRFRYKKFFAQVFYNSNNSGNANPNDLSGTYYLRTGIPVVDKSTVLVGQVQQGFSVGDAKFTMGADYIKTAPRSEGSIFGRNEGATDILEYGAYLQGDAALTPKLNLVSAIRGDMSDRITGTQFSPRLALVYKADATNNIRLTFSRAFNSPASFSYFLDQVSNPNQAPGFALRAVGNPPKEGWQFARSCDATVNAGLCMHSPWVAAGTASNQTSSASVSFKGFMQALPTIIAGLPTTTVSAANKAQLTAILTGINPIFAAAPNPTPAQLGTILRIGSTAVTAVDTKDLSPLTASFDNTMELGYKGIINNKLRVAVDLWYQIRQGTSARTSRPASRPVAPRPPWPTPPPRSTRARSCRSWRSSRRAPWPSRTRSSATISRSSPPTRRDLARSTSTASTWRSTTRWMRSGCSPGPSRTWGRSCGRRSAVQPIRTPPTPRSTAPRPRSATTTTPTA